MSTRSTWNPATDIPDLSGKVFLITGGTAGLGAGTIRNLAANNPGHIFFTGRNTQTANDLIASVHATHPFAQLTFLRCDMTRLDSMRVTAQTFRSLTDRLDVLICNAGIMATAAAVTPDGFEEQFQVNYLAHAVLVRALLIILRATPDSRVITLSSIAHAQAPRAGIAFASLRTPQATLGGLIPGPRWSRYGQSKLAALLLADELALREPSITAVSLHPGVVNTNLFTSMSWGQRALALFSTAGRYIPLEQGTHNLTWAATCPTTALRSGEYYEPVARVGRRRHRKARDPAFARQLWEWT